MVLSQRDNLYYQKAQNRCHGKGADDAGVRHGLLAVQYLNLRERMKPYIARLMKEAHEKGTPVMRPLFYDFPEDPRSWDQEDEYLFGPDVLVAPVMYAKTESREVYLPGGEAWVNFWTGESFEGGRTVTVPAPLDQIPLFVRNQIPWEG